MKRFVAALCLATVLSPILKAQDLNPADLDKAVKYLEKTRADLLQATKGLSEAQWNFKPGPDRWSIAEVTEHIAAAEDLLMGMVREKVMPSPPQTEAADVKEVDAFVLKAIPDRSKKQQAPEPLRPTNRYGSPKDALKHFQESRAQTILYVSKTSGLRQHAMAGPAGKKFDAYEWVLFVGAHSERHTKQINEVKADPNFPKA